MHDPASRLLARVSSRNLQDDKYRDGLKRGPVLLSNGQAGPDRKFSQPRDPFLACACCGGGGAAVRLSPVSNELVSHWKALSVCRHYWSRKCLLLSVKSLRHLTLLRVKGIQWISRLLAESRNLSHSTYRNTPIPILQLPLFTEVVGGGGGGLGGGAGERRFYEIASEILSTSISHFDCNVITATKA